MGIAVMLKKLLLGRAFSAENGRVTILGRYNVSMVESGGLAYLIQKLWESVGEEKAFKILVKCSEIAAKNLLKNLGYEPSLSNFEKALPFMDFYGWGKFSLDHKYEDDKTLKYIIRVTNSPISEYGKQLFGRNSRVCLLIRANLYGGVKLATKTNVTVKENACFCRGSESCIFEINIKKGSWV